MKAMKASVSEDVFTEILPFFVVCKWLGAAPYFIRGSPGSRQLVPIKSKLYICMPYIAILLPCFVFLTGAESLNVLKSQNLGLYSLLIFQLFSNLAITVPLPFLHNRYRNFFKYSFLQLTNLDKEMLNLGIRIDHKHMQKVNLAKLIVQGGMLLLAMGCSVYVTRTMQNLACCLTFFFRFIGVTAARTSFYSATTRLQLLNTYLGRSKHVDLIIPFITISGFIATIQRITCLTNSLYSYLFLLELTADFSSLLVICYKFWRELFVENSLSTEELVFFSVFLVYTLTEMLSLIYTCDKVPRSIMALTLQLSHSEPDIKAGKFFILDFSLVFSIVGALSTYLVILIQFDTTNLN